MTEGVRYKKVQVHERVHRYVWERLRLAASARGLSVGQYAEFVLQSHADALGDRGEKPHHTHEAGAVAHSGAPHDREGDTSRLAGLPGKGRARDGRGPRLSQTAGVGSDR